MALLTSETEVLSWIYSLQDLPYREYSIASIMQSGSLDLVVRQEITARGLGLGSGLLTAYTSLGTEIKARVRANPAFHSAKDIQQPIILIGNGSGIAGLVAHLQQLAVSGATQNLLIFGERHSSLMRCTMHKFNYGDNKVLTQVDYAFSQDEQAHKYVQDCLNDKAEQLKKWVEQSASIYVYGSLKGMAQDVNQTLIKILGQDLLVQLSQQQCYLRGVY